MAVPLDRVAVVAGLLPDSSDIDSDISPKVSIIIPTLNESELLDASLTRLFSIPAVRQHCEVIICDGGSQDDSVKIALTHNCRLVHSPSGRALQMNCGGKTARGNTLLFLHADSQLPENFHREIDSGTEWGFFRLRLSGQAFIYRVIETCINLRTQYSKVAGGDQGLYFQRDFFQTIGGFPQIPLMEDIAISKQARRLHAPKIVKQPLITSSRRWQEKGVLRTLLLMWSLRLAFWLGVNPRHLHRIYYQRG
jgi:rSAM/selenodomain-associated transferase 2